MTKEIFIVVMVILSIILITSIIAIFVSVHNLHVKIVKENSVAYKDLMLLNNSYHFHSDIEDRYKYHFTCNTKAKFDRFDLHSFFLNTIENHLTFFQDLIKFLDENNNFYAEYCSKYDTQYKLTEAETIKPLKISSKTFNKIDKRLYEKEKLSPRLTTSVYCSVSYTSPAGRNHYFDSQCYSFNQIQRCYNVVLDSIKQKSTREYRMKMERAQLSASLRYDILKRDNFTCQICGATKDDGVKLHVDHIVPIAKGGKTEWHNLQTLCDRCNLGKRDKI